MSLPVTSLARMDYFSNLKAKRADKAATKEYKRLHAIWQEDVTTLTKLITIYTAAVSLFATYFSVNSLVRWFKKRTMYPFTIHCFLMDSVSIVKFA